jgi:hypothetical protein
MVAASRSLARNRAEKYGLSARLECAMRFPAAVFTKTGVCGLLKKSIEPPIDFLQSFRTFVSEPFNCEQQGMVGGMRVFRKKTSAGT